MKKILMLCFVSVILLTGCGGVTVEDFNSEEVLSVKEVPVSKDSVKKSVAIIGRVTYIDNSKPEGIVYWIESPKAEGVENDKYATDLVKVLITPEIGAPAVEDYSFVEVQGVVDGITTEADYNVNKLSVIASTVTVLEEKEVLSPTLKEITDAGAAVDKKVEYKITSVEFSPIDTRVFITVTNDSGSTYDPRHSSQLIADKKIFENTYSMIDFGVEELPSEIPNGTQAEAVMVFGPIDSESITDLKFTTSGYVGERYDDAKFEIDVI